MKIYAARIEGMGKTGKISRYFRDRDSAIQSITDRFPGQLQDWDGSQRQLPNGPTVLVKGIVVHD